MENKIKPLRTISVTDRDAKAPSSASDKRIEFLSSARTAVRNINQNSQRHKGSLDSK